MLTTARYQAHNRMLIHMTLEFFLDHGGGAIGIFKSPVCTTCNQQSIMSLCPLHIVSMLYFLAARGSKRVVCYTWSVSMLLHFCMYILYTIISLCTMSTPANGPWLRNHTTRVIMHTANRYKYIVVFFHFFLHPVYCSRTTLALPPSSNSDPGPYSGPSSPLPLRYVPSFLSRE